MNKKLSGGPAAVIEIGSSAVRMRVSQLKHGEIEMLDSLEYPVFFGHEVFTTGRISFESLRQLSSILTKFTTICTWKFWNTAKKKRSSAPRLSGF